MMKERILPLFLAAAAAVSMTACGQKNEVADINLYENDVELAPLEEKKLSPAEEKEIATPEPDSVGNMMVYPCGYDDTGCLYGTNTLTFYFENEGVVGGEGLIYTYESPSGDAFQSVSTASSNVTVSPMDEAGRLYTGWDKGTKIDVCFSEVFERNKNYYVLLDPGAFRLNENLSKSITQASLIAFRVKDYGFEPFSTEILNGDKFSADIKLGGDAVSAYCECICASKGGVLTESTAEAKVIEEQRFTEDGTFSPDLTEFEDSAVAFKITYFDEKGTSIDSSSFVLTVGFPTSDDVAQVKANVFGTVEAADVVDTEDAQYTELEEKESGTELSEGGASSVVIDEPEGSSASATEATLPADSAVTDSASANGIKAPTAQEAAQAGEGANFKSASVSEHIHSEVDKALKGKNLTTDEKGALIVDTLNTLASEGFVKEGTPFYDKNSESVTYVDANGKRERTRIQNP